MGALRRPESALMPAVSIIMPTYNRAKAWLEQAVASVQGQTFTDWELIVVDDGSTDGTPELVERLARREPRLRLHRTPHAGVSAARNAGLGLARGRFAAFLDDDDVWMPNRLQRQVEYLTKNPEYGLIYAQAATVDGEGRIIGLKPGRRAATDFDGLLDGNCIPMPTVLARRDCLAAVGGFDRSLRIAEDYDLWLRLARRFPIAYLPQPLAQYRRHDTNASGNPRDHARALLTVYRKLLVRGDGADERRLTARLASTRHLLGRLELYHGDPRAARHHLVQARAYWRRTGRGSWRPIFKVYVLWTLTWMASALPWLTSRWERREPQLFYRSEHREHRGAHA
jgi:glycosyltransferase involved in cell wall biosynthesis